MLNEFWELLNDVEDKINFGYREEHQTPKLEEGSNSSECRECPLYLVRNSIVHGSGSDNPKLMIIGTWPTDEDEDNGLPLSGDCEAFLNKWISAMKLSPVADCYITNLLKCKTGWNKRGFQGRHDHSDEIKICFSHMEEEIHRLKPRVILTLGEKPAQIFTDSSKELEQLRGHVHLYKGIPVINTYHPEIALENYDVLRAPVWEDLKLVISRLNG